MATNGSIHYYVHYIEVVAHSNGPMLRRQWVKIKSVGVHWHIASTTQGRKSVSLQISVLFVAYVM